MSMAYNLATAALATGVNKSTVLRAIKGGRISATRTEAGWEIEVAELHRVFPPLPAMTTGEQPAVPRDATADALVQALRDQLADMRQERDRWHAAFEASEGRMQRLLPPPATADAAPGNRWRKAWRWLRSTG
jgi:hypothetical protein